MERINGYRNIGDFKKLNRKIVPSLYAKAWYTDGEYEYLFKIVNSYIAYKELFYSIYMRKINFPTIEIDLAVLGNKFGIIAKNYNSNHLPCYAIEEILDEYWKEKIRKINEEKRFDLIPTINYEHDFNLERLPKIIDWFLRNHKRKSDLEQEGCLLEFIAQVIGGNTDLRSQNMEIYIEDKAKFSPLYDFGGYGEINLQGKRFPYRFQNQRIRKKEVITPQKTLERFLKNAPKKEIEEFKKYLELARDESKVEKTIQEMKEQTNHIIPEKIETRIKKRVKQNINNIQQIVE